MFVPDPEGFEYVRSVNFLFSIAHGSNFLGFSIGADDVPLVFPQIKMNVNELVPDQLEESIVLANSRAGSRSRYPTIFGDLTLKLQVAQFSFHG